MNDSTAVHPRPERIREFVRRLRALPAFTERYCDMVDTNINRAPECGTPGCHAGWAAIALGSSAKSYSPAAAELSEFLLPTGTANANGPTSNLPISRWASENPEWWGSDYGGYMFSSSLAFNQHTERFAATILADWWEAVATRLENEVAATAQ